MSVLPRLRVGSWSAFAGPALPANGMITGPTDTVDEGTVVVSWRASGDVQIGLKSATTAITVGSGAGGVVTIPVPNGVYAFTVENLSDSPLASFEVSMQSYTKLPEDITAVLSDRGGQVYNVQAYGAVGDGTTTNDTATIQAAIDAASSGSDVFFPYTSAGYLCGALTIPPGVRLVFSAGAKLIAPATLAASWIVAEPNVVHDGTSIVGGTFDATAVTSASVTAVIDFGQATSVPNVRIAANRVINAPVHGIFLHETTYTANTKWVDSNAIEGHGVVSTGYGIYGDYIGGLLITRNYVSGTGGDGIELGHSGAANLGGLDAHMGCVGNVVVGGGIQYPHSDGVLIADNIITNGTQGIQNDTNSVIGATIVGNTLTDISPGSGYGAISMCGSKMTCCDNTITLATTSTEYGIGGLGAGGSFTDTTVANNTVCLTASGQTGITVNNTSAITTRNAISDNHVFGTATNGISIGANNVSVRGNTVAVSGTGILVYGNATLGYTPDAVDLVDNDVSQSGTGYSVTSMPTNCRWINNKGISPGTLTATVPASGTSVPVSGTSAEFWNSNANYTSYAFDRTYYVTAASSGTTTVQTTNGPVITVPPSACVTVFVPAGETLTPTYTSAPTWVIQGH